jgi:hypothetical protein
MLVEHRISTCERLGETVRSRALPSQVYDSFEVSSAFDEQSYCAIGSSSAVKWPVKFKLPVDLIFGAGLAQLRRGAQMLSFNVFRSREGFSCAVPEDRPVPPFLTSKAWEFSGKITGDHHNLPPATEVAVRFNGFYVFRPFETPRELVSKGA